MLFCYDWASKLPTSYTAYPLVSRQQLHTAHKTTDCRRPVWKRADPSRPTVSHVLQCPSVEDTSRNRHTSMDDFAKRPPNDRGITAARTPEEASTVADGGLKLQGGLHARGEWRVRFPSSGTFAPSKFGATRRYARALPVTEARHLNQLTLHLVWTGGSGARWSWDRLALASGLV
jgi:hypothetical protein